jgi:GGDEF domain-containing protein
MEMAMTDVLTDLPNRRALDEQLTRFIADAARTGLPFSVIAVDLDGMKQVNDGFGHDAGDDLLRNFGRAVKGAIRGSDVGLRIGGDEFPHPASSNERGAGEARRGAPYRDRGPFPRAVRSCAVQLWDREPPGRRIGEEVLARADVLLRAAKRDRAAPAMPVEPGT